jgi:hypothetical protein
MNVDTTAIWLGSLVLKQDSLARAVFEVVSENLASAGYGIARKLI